jgi:hypothetical protein
MSSLDVVTEHLTALGPRLRRTGDDTAIVTGDESPGSTWSRNS